MVPCSCLKQWLLTGSRDRRTPGDLSCLFKGPPRQDFPPPPITEIPTCFYPTSAPEPPYSVAQSSPSIPPTHTQTGHMLSKSPPFPQRCTAKGHEYLGDQGVLCGHSPIIYLFVSLQVTGRSFFTLSWDSSSRQAGSAILFQGLHVLQTSLSL